MENIEKNISMRVLVFLFLVWFLFSSILFYAHLFLALNPCIKHLLSCKGEIESCAVAESTSLSTNLLGYISL